MERFGNAVKKRGVGRTTEMFIGCAFIPATEVTGKSSGRWITVARIAADGSVRSIKRFQIP